MAGLCTPSQHYSPLCPTECLRQENKTHNTRQPKPEMDLFTLKIS